MASLKEENLLLLERRKKSNPRQYRTFWSTEFGWLTPWELRVVEKNGVLNATEDEKKRGYRLTEEIFKDRLKTIRKEREDGVTGRGENRG